MKIAINNNCCLLFLKEEKIILRNDSQVALFDHLVQRLPIKPIEKPYSLQIPNNVINLIMMKAILELIILSKVYHGESIVFFQKLLPSEMTVQVYFPTREAWTFHNL